MSLLQFPHICFDNHKRCRDIPVRGNQPQVGRINTPTARLGRSKASPCWRGCDFREPVYMYVSFTNMYNYSSSWESYCPGYPVCYSYSVRVDSVKYVPDFTGH